MEKTEIIIAFILWCLYALFEGNREAYYYHFLWRGYSAIWIEPKNLHINYTLQRSLVLGLVCLINFNWWLISLPLVWSFLHNGCYYLTRNRLNRSIYKKGWFAQSYESNAITTKIFTPWVRSVLFAVGISIIISYL